MLEQPHTSAGRVPTAAAFRYYVEQITQSGRWPTGANVRRRSSMAQSPSLLSSLSEARREQIERELSRRDQHNEYLERTSQVLALMSSGLGVALASGDRGRRCWSTFIFRGSRNGRVLAVLVTQAGAVQDRVLIARSRTDACGAGDRGALSEREFSRLADRAHSRRGGAAHGTGTRCLSSDAGLGRRALPQGRAGRRRKRARRFLWTAWPT